MNKQPEKTAQTRRSIIDAFWTVAAKRGLGSVTVSEITKTAGLNRGTFYVYFSDVDELIYQAEQEILEDFKTRMLSAISMTDFRDFRLVTEKVIEILGGCDDRLYLLLGKDGDPMFTERVRKAAVQVFGSIMNTGENHPYQEYVSAFIINAFAGLLRFWHESGKELPLEDLAGIAHTMALTGMLGMKEQLNNT